MYLDITSAISFLIISSISGEQPARSEIRRIFSLSFATCLEDFLLKKEFRTKEEHPQIFREGIYLIELIRNRTYMLNSLCNLNEIIEIMIQIVSSSSITNDFISRFQCFKNGKPVKIELCELKIFHNIIGKVLKDSKTLPKALIMKYIFSTLLGGEPEKSEVQRIYGVYLLSVLFTIFENKRARTFSSGY